MNSNNAASNTPTDLEAGQQGQESFTPTIAQPVIASDPSTYGQGLYFGPQFIGTVDTTEELGNTAWRRVGGYNNYGHINHDNNYSLLSFNGEIESYRCHNNTNHNSKKPKVILKIEISYHLLTIILTN
jgi:hypothetical protein